MIISQGKLCTYEYSVFKINVYFLERMFLYFSALYFSWVFACGSYPLGSLDAHTCCCPRIIHWLCIVMD